MKRILLCTGEEESFDNELLMFRSYNNEMKIEHIAMFKNNSKLNKIFRNLGEFFVKKAINDILKEKIDGYDVIIFFECVVKNKAIKIIRENNPNLRIIIYFRNQFSYSKKRNLSLKFLKKYDCEFWSYNKKDCENLNFKYNSQFWNINYYKKIEKKSSILYNFCFLGRVKGREKELIELEKFSKQSNKENFFYLVPKTEYNFDKNISDKYMSYVDYLNIAQKSLCIVDLVSSKNYGLTLRPLEAQFLKKKLITNYKDIEKYDFYDKNNIFILGKDSIQLLQNFLETAYIENFKDLDKYNFDSWIFNFFK